MLLCLFRGVDEDEESQEQRQRTGTEKDQETEKSKELRNRNQHASCFAGSEPFMSRRPILVSAVQRDFLIPSFAIFGDFSKTCSTLMACSDRDESLIISLLVIPLLLSEDPRRLEFLCRGGPHSLFQPSSFLFEIRKLVAFVLEGVVPGVAFS